jgi:hypothetical protein
VIEVNAEKRVAQSLPATDADREDESGVASPGTKEIEEQELEEEEEELVEALNQRPVPPAVPPPPPHPKVEREPRPLMLWQKNEFKEFRADVAEHLAAIKCEFDSEIDQVIEPIRELRKEVIERKRKQS